MHEHYDDQLLVWGKPGIPRSLDKLPVRAISAGSAHLVLQLAAGEVISTGCNRFGQLALNDRTLKSLGQFRVVPGMLSKKVVCGMNHTVFLSVDGSAFAAGKNDNGQLGLGDTKSRWEAVQIGKGHYIDAFAGGCNSALLSSTGRFQVCGCNQNGQLGQNSRQLNTFVPLKEETVISAAFGYDFALYLRRGEVITGGNNSRGQLGLGHKRAMHRLVAIDNFKHESVTKILASDHAAAITASGNLYIWGAGSFGEFLVPTRISKARYPFVDASLGDRFGLVLDEKGSLYAWGNNSSGELGVPGFHSQNTPVLVSGSQGKRVSQIACGGGFSAILFKSLQSSGELSYNLSMNEAKQMKQMQQDSFRQNLIREKEFIERESQLMRQLTAKEFDMGVLKKELEKRSVSEKSDIVEEYKQHCNKLELAYRSTVQENLRLSSREQQLLEIKKRLESELTLREEKLLQIKNQLETDSLSRQRQAAQQRNTFARQLQDQKRNSLQIQKEAACLKSQLQQTTLLNTTLQQKNSLLKKELDHTHHSLGKAESELKTANAQLTQEMSVRTKGEIERGQVQQLERELRSALGDKQHLIEEFKILEKVVAELKNNIISSQEYVVSAKSKLLQNEDQILSKDKRIIILKSQLQECHSQIAMFKEELDHSNRLYVDNLGETVRQRQRCDEELKILEEKMKVMMKDYQEQKLHVAILNRQKQAVQHESRIFKEQMKSRQAKNLSQLSITKARLQDTEEKVSIANLNCQDLKMQLAMLKEQIREKQVIEHENKLFKDQARNRQTRILADLSTTQARLQETVVREDQLRGENTKAMQRIRGLEFDNGRLDGALKSVQEQASKLRKDNEVFELLHKQINLQLEKKKQEAFQTTQSAQISSQEARKAKLEISEALSRQNLLEGENDKLRDQVEQQQSRLQVLERTNRVLASQRSKWEEDQNLTARSREEFDKNLVELQRANEELSMQARSALQAAQDSKRSLDIARGMLQSKEADIQGYLIKIKELEQRNNELSQLLTDEIDRQAEQYKTQTFRHSRRVIQNLGSIIASSHPLSNQHNYQSTPRHLHQTQSLQISQLKVSESPLKAIQQNSAKKIFQEKTIDHKRRISESAARLLQLLEGGKDLSKVSQQLQQLDSRKEGLVERVEQYKKKLQVLSKN